MAQAHLTQHSGMSVAGPVASRHSDFNLTLRTPRLLSKSMDSPFRRSCGAIRFNSRPNVLTCLGQ